MSKAGNDERWGLSIASLPANFDVRSDFMGQFRNTEEEALSETDNYTEPCRLLNDSSHEALKRNGRIRRASIEAGAGDEDFLPVVKLFAPDAMRTWLLTEISPDNPDQAFGLIDLEDGKPEMGTASLSALSAYRGPKDLPIERDIYFVADKPISVYAAIARHYGKIMTEGPTRMPDVVFPFDVSKGR